MKKFPYYPGCTLKQYPKKFGIPSEESARALGLEMVEIPRWNCCGAVASLTADDMMHQVAPIRNLIRVQEMNDEGLVDNEYRLVVFCSMCFNTLKRANMMVKENEAALNTINEFMDREQDYKANVEVVHFLEILRDMGFYRLEDMIKKPLKGLKIAPYYGCNLLRPKEVGIDNPEAPTIMENFVEALGAEVIDNPLKSLCCGSYHTVGGHKDIVAERTYAIVNAARKAGADMMITACPLCAFNLDDRQALTKELHPEFQHMPVLYFTQILAFALGLEDKAGLEENYVDARPILREKGLMD